MSQTTDLLKQMQGALLLFDIATDLVVEANRGSKLHDNSHLIDGTGPGYGREVVRDLHDRFLLNRDSAADVARERCQAASKTDAHSWERVLTEEIFEAFEEDDLTRLRAELVQSGAVILNWIASIDNREN